MGVGWCNRLQTVRAQTTRRSECSCPQPVRAMPTNLFPATPNRVLSRLSAEDFALLLAPHLKRINLPLRKQLETRNKRIEYVYFPESGFASVVANGTGHSIEVGLIGREGMTGLAVVMGADKTPHDTFIQSPGAGLRITAEKLRQALAKGPTLQRSCLLYAHAFGLQTTYTAIANGRSKIEERLARWLLMARDRVDTDDLTLTHEFLSLMLGVRRPGVTGAIHILVTQGLIKAHRGIISIVDRNGLEKTSNGAYGVPEAEFQRLFG
jgi:CRP-like cAMP-binding protein